MIQEMFNFLLLGGSIFGFKHAFGAGIERTAVNYLGQRKGDVATIIFYVFGFFYALNRVN